MPEYSLSLLGGFKLSGPDGQRIELTSKKLLWDGPTMRFTNSDEANKFLRREYRPGWSV